MNHGKRWEGRKSEMNLRQRGFTLLEIIVVVFILSILAALVAPRIIGRTDDARIADARLQIKNFETALKLYKVDNGFYDMPRCEILHKIVSSRGSLSKEILKRIAFNVGVNRT